MCMPRKNSNIFSHSGLCADGQEAEAPPFQASAADYEFPDSDKDEPEAEAAAHCLSEMAATPRAHLRSAAARPAGKGKV